MKSLTPTPASSATHLRGWRQVQRLLVVRLDNLGDLLMCTPALAALRQALPRAHITLLCSPSGVALVPHLEMIDAAIAVDAPWVRHGRLDQQAARPGETEEQLLALLRAERFDAAVIFTSCTQSALPAASLLRMAGLPLTLAYCRENPYALLSDWVPEEDHLSPGSRHEVRHEVQRQLDLLRHIGIAATPGGADGLRIRLRSEDLLQAHERLRQSGLDPRRPYLLLHPGASAESRRWPPEYFGSAAQMLAEQSGLQVALCGSQADAPLLRKAVSAMLRPCAVLSDVATVGELAALIGDAALLVANNSAPSHLAAALGTPVVCLYALTNPQHRPWRVPSAVLNHDVDCRYCLKSQCPQGHHACLRKVGPNEVTQAALRLLGVGQRPEPATCPEGEAQGETP